MVQQPGAGKQRDAVASEDRRAQPGERQGSVAQRVNQLGMLAVVRVLDQVLMVVGQDPAELDEPAGHERKQRG